MTQRYSKNCVVCGLKFGEAYHCPYCKHELEKAYIARREVQTKKGFVCQFCAEEGAHRTNSRTYKTNTENYYPEELETLLFFMRRCSKQHDNCNSCPTRVECEHLYSNVCNDGKPSEKEIARFSTLLRGA